MCPTGTTSCTMHAYAEGCLDCPALPCLALPAESARPTRKGAVLLNKCRKQGTLEEENEVSDSKAFDGNPSGFNQLQFVKSFTVHAACPFNIAKHARIRRCRSLLCPKKLRVDGLNNRAVSTIYSLVLYIDLFASRSVALYLGQYPIE